MILALSVPDKTEEEILKVEHEDSDGKIPEEQHEVGHNDDVLQPGTSSRTSSPDDKQIQK